MAKFQWNDRASLEAKEQAERLQAMRQERDRLLRETDWTQLPDSPLSPQEQAAWAAYRKALRDLPSQVDSKGKSKILFPNPPSASPRKP